MTAQDPSAAIREALESPAKSEAERRDLLTQALIYAEEVRNGYVIEKSRADELEKAKNSLESSAKELEQNLDALRRTDQERRKLLHNLVKAQEDERKRIAGEIHDDSIQVMAAVGMRIASIRKKVSDKDALSLLDRLEETIEESIRRLRSLLFVLRPISLEREGLAAALREYIAMNRQEEGPSYELMDNLDTQPTGEVPIVLFRIAQEALTNIRKHARAQNVQLELSPRDHGILMTVRDDGKGFVPAEGLPGHLGIIGSRERAEQTGGWFRIESAPGEGTTIKCWIPSGPVTGD